MTPEALAAIHSASFTIPRPWSAPEFRDLLATPGAFLLTRNDAFLLGRVIADEAELLTLAVAPGARRAGLGRELAAEFAVTSRQNGAVSAFLEVAADNAPARALYLGAGWQEAGLRRRYYGPDLDGIVMRLALASPQEGG
ncbi:GNAT family N-acetyltransferase [Paracoccus caeni]|uniref:GNAT family N-acetyltransferase n=1 Tax=Paracoccus caeni TaxID=657651 RepID=A0A934VYF1_9RHOB|nr:GNAT family N-acetyltransferase [Paracoccus caeni]MBK4214680.1 GNAT family N-acetyltransferase [Paracoccus caeni]